MDYYKTTSYNKELLKARISRLDGELVELMDNEIFKKYMKDIGASYKDLKINLHKCVNLIMSLADLATASNKKILYCDPIYYSDPIYYYNESESEFIKNYSFIYLYLRVKFEKDYSVVFLVNSTSYFLKCLIFGFASYEVDVKIQISDSELEETYLNIINSNNSIKFARLFPYDRELMNNFMFITTMLSESINSDSNIKLSRPVKFNIKSIHGLDYIALGIVLAKQLSKLSISR